MDSRKNRIWLRFAEEYHREEDEMFRLYSGNRRLRPTKERKMDWKRGRGRQQTSCLTDIKQWTA